MRPSTTARRYAQAAFAVAQGEGNASLWLQRLEVVAMTLQDNSIRLFFRDPAVGMKEKMAALDRSFGSFEPRILNLLKVLVSHHRVHLVPQILTEFRDLYRSSQGIEEARVTVAHQIDDAEKQRIAAKLSSITGKKVDLTVQVDPRILGGVVVQMGDRLVDASVSGRLQRLRQKLVV